MVSISIIKNNRSAGRWHITVFCDNRFKSFYHSITQFVIIFIKSPSNSFRKQSAIFHTRTVVSTTREQNIICMVVICMSRGGLSANEEEGELHGMIKKNSIDVAHGTSFLKHFG